MRILALILWLLLGVFYWYASTLCCSVTNEITKLTPPISSEEAIPCPPASSIIFKWNEDEPSFKQDWTTLRDSVLSGLEEDHLIQITGLYRKDERTPKDFDNLGLARSNGIFNKFEWNEDIARITSRLKPLDGRSKDCLLNGIEFRYVMNTTKIQEIDDRTLIYFPYNSTQKLNDLEVEEYLDKLAIKVSQTKERILLTGHTDNTGDSFSNKELGVLRAQVIQSYLLQKGVDPSLIECKSEGEENPVATNDSKEGRAKNRRTELKLISNEPY